MTTIDPEDDLPNHPIQPARITGIRPNLPARFMQGDPLPLYVDLDRPLTALECRVIAYTDNTVWTVREGDNCALVQFTHIDDDTFDRLQTALVNINTQAEQEAEKASRTRNALAQQIEKWETK